MLSELSRAGGGPAASQEAVDLGRRLAAARPETFLPDLARKLSNLGMIFSNLGQGGGH